MRKLVKIVSIMAAVLVVEWLAPGWPSAAAATVGLTAGAVVAMRCSHDWKLQPKSKTWWCADCHKTRPFETAPRAVGYTYTFEAYDKATQERAVERHTQNDVKRRAAESQIAQVGRPKAEPVLIRKSR